MYDNIFITPYSASWDSYSKHFAKSEDATLACNVDLVDISNCQIRIPPPDDDPYHNYLSVDAVNIAMNTIIKSRMDNHKHHSEPIFIHENRSLLNCEAHTVIDEQLNNALFCKLSTAFKMTPVGNTQ